MPTRKEMLKTINQKIANKDLTLGCLFIGPDDITYQVCYKYENIIYTTLGLRFHITDIKDIIGCPIMIGDVLNYIEKNIYRNHNINIELLKIRKDKIKSIDYQRMEVTEYIYNLCKE